jgi:predicted esterase
MSGVIIHTIETRSHGRYLVWRPDAAGDVPMLVGFHGYGESAETMFDNLRAVAGAEPWCLVSAQGLHRFYTRRNEIVASWMTSQDRDLEIADNTSYVWSVVRAVERGPGVRRPLVFVGFSQGVAMAYRAAAAGGCDGLILLAGDVPPDVVPRASQLPPVLLGRGVGDEWYTEAKASADLVVLRAAGVAVTEHVFDAGHLWHESFTRAAQIFLRGVKMRAAGHADTSLG